MFNEATVLIAAYHLLGFTEWVFDMERRMELGWSLIAMIVLNVCFNFTILTNYMVRRCIQSIRKKLKQKYRAKLMAQHREIISRRRAQNFLKMEAIKEVSNDEESSPRKEVFLVAARMPPSTIQRNKRCI